MFVTLYSYRAKPGQMQAIHSLYRQWQCLLENGNAISAELLLNRQDPGELIMLARFQDEDAAWDTIESADYRAWYARLAQLAETGPIVSQYEMQQDGMQFSNEGDKPS